MYDIDIAVRAIDSGIQSEVTKTRAERLVGNNELHIVHKDIGFYIVVFVERRNHIEEAACHRAFGESADHIFRDILEVYFVTQTIHTIRAVELKRPLAEVLIMVGLKRLGYYTDGVARGMSQHGQYNKC